MSQRDLLRLVLSNLNRMRARVALTAIGVLIGTAAVVLLISLAVGLQTSATAEISAFGDLTTIQVFRGSAMGIEDPSQRRRGPEAVLDDRALREIGDLDHVVAVTPQQGVSGGGVEFKYGRVSTWANVRGVKAEEAPKLGWDLASGSPRLGRGQIVIGQKVFGQGRRNAPRRGSRSGPVRVDAVRTTPEPLEMQGRSLTAILTKFTEEDNKLVKRTERLRVAGMFKETDGQNDWSVYMSLDDVEAFNQWLTGSRRNPREGYDRALVKVDDRERVAVVQKAVRELGFETFSSQDMLAAINQVFLIMQAILGSIGGVALLVAAFGIANTMTMAIYERTREIGIMKALGATNRDVMRIFLFEAAAIGVIGGLLGVATGWGLGKGIEVFVRTQLQGPGGAPPSGEQATSFVVTPWWLMAFALTFATLVGLLSGIYPAMRAASMKPLRALRTE